MSVSDLFLKMVDWSNGNRHDISHFLKVHGFARAIAESEQLSEKEQMIVETAALIHDIACPLCREKYGNTDGRLQEKEGVLLAERFLEGTGLDEDAVDRIVFLVGHHHTLKGIDGMDWQILVEADYLVNADESGYSKANIENMLETVFKTKTGKHLLRSIYLGRTDG